MMGPRLRGEALLRGDLFKHEYFSMQRLKNTQ